MVFSSDTCSMNFLKTPPHTSICTDVYEVYAYGWVCVYICVEVYICACGKRLGWKAFCTGQRKHCHNWSLGQQHERWQFWDRTGGWKLGLVAQLWIKSFQLSFPFLRKETLQGWCEIKQQRFEKMFLEMSVPIQRDITPLGCRVRRVTFICTSMPRSEIHSQHSLLSAKEEEMWTIFQRANAF